MPPMVIHFATEHAALFVGGGGKNAIFATKCAGLKMRVAVVATAEGRNLWRKPWTDK
jgi:hypothetical protein